MNAIGPLAHVPFERVDAALREHGVVIVAPDQVAAWTRTSLDALDALHRHWGDLPPDGYLRDGGRYRYRRHASFTVEGDAVRQMPHRAHYQPLDYNALHGGMERWFEPLAAELTQADAFQALLRTLARAADALRGARTWFVEAHAFRIDTAQGIGRPTPEGAHRDGVDLVAVFLLQRHAIKGGESRVFEADGPHGLRFTLHAPWSLLLMDDTRVIHESTPIQPEDDTAPGWRDTLVVTLRSGGFLAP